MDYSKPLKNQRHERFAIGLFEGKTQDQAYADAGFKPNRGNTVRMKANESIQGRLAFLQAEAAKEVIVDHAWITERLVENVNRAMEAVPNTDSEGKPTGVFTYQGAVANKALDTLGRHVSYFPKEDKAPVQVYVNGVVEDGESRAARFDAALAAQAK